MRLRFPPLAGGVIQGLNDAGVETFKGNDPHFVVRECAQNSLDAAASHEKPVRMEITVHTLPVSAGHLTCVQRLLAHTAEAG